MLILALATLALTGQSSLTLAETLEVPGPAGRYDYLTADPGHHRILAAHAATSSMTVVHTDSKKVEEIALGASCNGVTVDPVDGLILLAGPGKKLVSLNADTLQVVGTLPLEGPGDAMEWNPKTGKVYVDEDDGTHVWVIDPKTLKVEASVEIAGAPEWIQYDPKCNRIFQNIKKPEVLQVIDIEANKVVATYPQAGVTSPHGLAVDPEMAKVFSAGKNGVLVQIDESTGKIESTAKIAPGVDQMAYDAESKTLYCACTGAISVVQVTPEGLKSLGEVKAPAGVHTLAIDPESHDVWVAYADKAHSYVARFAHAAK